MHLFSLIYTRKKVIIQVKKLVTEDSHFRSAEDRNDNIGIGQVSSFVMGRAITEVAIIKMLNTDSVGHNCQS